MLMLSFGVVVYLLGSNGSSRISQYPCVNAFSIDEYGDEACGHGQLYKENPVDLTNKSQAYLF